MINKKNLSWITNCPASDINFQSNLKEANVQTIEEALTSKYFLTNSAIKKLQAELKKKLSELEIKLWKKNHVNGRG